MLNHRTLPILFVALLSVSARTMDSWSYDVCSTPSDPMQISSITMAPDPPQRGQELNVTISASVTARIEKDAYADAAVKFGLTHLLQKQFELCDEVRQAGMSVQCPLEPGDYAFTQTFALRKDIPAAKYDIAVLGYTPDDDPLFCLHLAIDFTKDSTGGST